MNTFRADLHVHSRFSRATSKKLNIRDMAAWGMLKGLDIIATGDFTHPTWREELRRDLVFDDNTGLYRVRENVPVAEVVPGFVSPADRREPFFLIEAEISSIYKKNGKVRKIHNLVFMPTLESADRLSTRLGAIGNITSDGRPILGIDSEKLLEIVLETDERAFFIPAHIWTPWFSLFGSKSGFDTLEECFGSLSSHIFALETGLSSDPDMNRLWSALDKYTLVSNSDAHSAENLGREANLFSGSPDYDGMFAALKPTSQKQSNASCSFQGTIEFFPEEGKYHLDGHRACGIVLEPGESMKLGNICPVCGRPLTVGVLHRVMALADRQTPVNPSHDRGYTSLFPLPEMLGELLGTGPKSRKVQAKQAELIRTFGSELDILQTTPESDLRQYWDALGEAVGRTRRGRVIRKGGFDGEYGIVRVFTEEERRDIVGGTRGSGQLISMPIAKPTAKTAEKKPGFVTQSEEKTKIGVKSVPTPETSPELAFRKASANAVMNSAPASRKHCTPSLLDVFAQAAAEAQAADSSSSEGPGDATGNAAASLPFPYSSAQLQAIDAGPHPILVLAGPGTGKTRTLVGRILRLCKLGVPTKHILAITYTRRAAAELRERLHLAMPEGSVPQADTLHAVALSLWTNPQPIILSEEDALACFAKANRDLNKKQLNNLWTEISLARERLSELPEDLAVLLDNYRIYKAQNGMADYTDLLEHWLRSLENGESTPIWTDILVDEIQDLSPLQIALVRALLPANRIMKSSAGTSGVLGPGDGFFGIGDPDQSIYGFRGATPDIRADLTRFWPNLQTITLAASHRSTAGILTSANNLLGAHAVCGQLQPTRSGTAMLQLFTAPDGKREANWIADQIANLLGGTSHTLEDTRSRNLPIELDLPFSPGEIAVLVRTKALMPPLRTALERKGIPCTVPETDPFWKNSSVAMLLAMAGAHFGIPLLYPELTSAPTLSDELAQGLWQNGPQEFLMREAPHPFDSLFRESTGFNNLLRSFREHGSWQALLEWVRLGQDIDLTRSQSEQVQIMTLHAAKGLEFRAVFLPALEDGLLPFRGLNTLLQKGKQSERTAGEASPELEEDRRLLYVGMTRAQDAIFASHAEQRQLYGHKLRLAPSPFLNMIREYFQQNHLKRHTKHTTRSLDLL